MFSYYNIVCVRLSRLIKRLLTYLLINDFYAIIVLNRGPSLSQADARNLTQSRSVPVTLNCCEEFTAKNIVIDVFCPMAQ